MNDAPEIIPFPGLRPFRDDETHLFFGREAHRRELLKRLAATRFVAVIGTSGSGKSSLIRAGLLPDLCAGYLPKSGSDWVVVDMAPGNDPMGRLAAEFERVGWPVSADDLRTDSKEILDLAERWLEQGQHLLVLVDQFEEFFRLRAREHPLEDRDEKSSFVRLLLNAGGQVEGVDREKSPRVHVVIAMRSEYLGRTSEYSGFPEAIDQGQYLIPRLSREQLRQAIVHPVHVANGEIEESLVQRLLNEMGNDQDQLPILQHALMRTWDYWKARERTAKLDADRDKLDDDCYRMSGTLENALSNHASDVLKEAIAAAGTDGERIIKRVFQSLRETDVNGGQSRRPTTVKELCEIVQCDRATLTKAIEPFRRQSFLRPSLEELGTQGDGLLPASALVDVSHEALLRRWTELRGWIEEDELDRRYYVRIASRAADEAGSMSPDYFTPPLLPELEKFWKDRQPPRAWAIRHHSGYEDARAFLEASGRHQKEVAEKELRAANELAAAQAKRVQLRRRVWIAAAAGLVIILFGSLVIITQRDYTATLQRQAATLRSQAERLETLVVSAKAATATVDSEIQSRLQLAAEAVSRQTSVVDTQPLLLQTLFAAAKPMGQIPFASPGVPPGLVRLALSSSGDVAFVSYASTLVAISVATKQEIFRVALENGRVLPSADGKRLVAIRALGPPAASGPAAAAPDVRILDGATGQQLAVVDVPRPRAYDVSQGSDLAAFAREDAVYLCRLSANCSDVITHRLTGHGLVDIELSPDGKLLVVDGGALGGQRTLVLYETEPWRQVVKREQPEPDGVKLVMSLDDQFVRWCSSTDLTAYYASDRSLDVGGNWPFPSPALQCSFSQNWVVTRHADGMLRVWDNAGAQVAMAGPVDDARALALAGPHLAAAGSQLRLWEAIGYGRRMADVPLRPGFYGGGAYALAAPPVVRLPPSFFRGASAARRAAVVGAAAATTAVAGAGRYDVESGTRSDLRFGLDNARTDVVSESLRAGVFVRNRNNQTQTPQLVVYGEIRETAPPLEKWDFAVPDGQVFERALIRADDRLVGVVLRQQTQTAQDIGQPRTDTDVQRTTFVFDAQGGRRLGQVSGEGVAFVPKSDNLIVRKGGRLSLWQSSGVQVPNAELEKIDRSEALRFSPDGNLLAVAVANDNEGGASELRQWVVSVLEWPRLAVRHSLSHPARVISLAFRMDSKALLAASGSATVHAWDLETGQETARVPVPVSRRRRTGPFLSVAFTPSGNIAFNDGAGFTVLANNPAAWIREACTRISRNLSEPEWERIMGQNVKYARTCPDLP